MIELLRKHAVGVSALREQVSRDPLYDPQRHDDLWLLRFYLSHHVKGGVAAAAAAARATLRHRHEIG